MRFFSPTTRLRVGLIHLLSLTLIPLFFTAHGVPVNRILPWAVGTESTDGFRIEGIIATGPAKTRIPVGITADMVEKAPLNPRAHALRGQSLLNQGYLSDSLEEFSAEFDLSFLPGISNHDGEIAREHAEINILKVLTTQKKYNQAEQYARSAWLMNPGYPGIAQYVGLFDLMHGRTAEAIAVLRDGYYDLESYSGGDNFRGPILAYLGNAYEIQDDCLTANALYAMARRDPDIQIENCKEKYPWGLLFPAMPKTKRNSFITRPFPGQNVSISMTKTSLKPS